VSHSERVKARGRSGVASSCESGQIALLVGEETQRRGGALVIAEFERLLEQTRGLFVSPNAGDYLASRKLLSCAARDAMRLSSRGARESAQPPFARDARQRASSMTETSTRPFFSSPAARSIRRRLASDDQSERAQATVACRLVTPP
jgi:hypothetical protein